MATVQDTSVLNVRLLGSLQAELDGTVLSLPKSRKARALLAYLFCHHQPQSRSKIGSLFFSSAADPAASVRWALSRLNAILPAEVIVTDGANVAMRAGSFVSDLGVLEQLLEDPDTNRMGDYFAHGIPFEDDFLEGLTFSNLPEFETWRLTMQAHCERLQSTALRAVLGSGVSGPRSIALAEKLVALDGQLEQSWSYLVASLSENGNDRDARRVLDLAHQQLARHKIAPTGLLHRSLAQLNKSHSHDKTLSDGGLNTFDRPTLAILSCEDLMGDAAPKLLKSIAAALFAAASCNKSCITMAFSAASGSGPSSQIISDYKLESRLVQGHGSTEIQVDFVETESTSCVFSWRETLPSDHEGDVWEFVTAFFSHRFEIDVQLALVGAAMRKPEELRTGFDWYYASLYHIYGAEGFDFNLAMVMLDKALFIDPYLGCAYAVLAWVRTTHPDFNFRAEDRKETKRLARKAVENCRDDPFILAWGATVIAHVEGDTSTAMDIVLRALSINPYSTMSLICAGIITNLNGDDEASLIYLERAEQWGSSEPLTFLVYSTRASVGYQTGDYDNGLIWARKAVGRNPTYAPALRLLAAILSHLGKIEEATQVATTLYETDPSEHVEYFHEHSVYQIRDTVDRLCADLAKAGLPLTGP